MKRILSVAAVLIAVLGALPAKEKLLPVPVVLKPESLSWTRLPSGVEMAVLQGDPKAKGLFTLRLRYPAGYRKGPHFHPGDALVTVLEGSYFRAYGNVFDEAGGIALTPGTFSVNPAKVSHYEWTTGPALIQVTARGPWTTVYVDEQGRQETGTH